MGRISDLYVAFSFLYLFAYHGAVILRSSCGAQSVYFSSVSRLRLKNGLIGSTIQDVPFLSLCVKKCIDEIHCKSVNYNNGTQECDLLEKHLGIHNEIIKESEGWAHYEDSFYEPLVGPACNKLKPCGDGECVDTCRDNGYDCTCNYGEMINGKCVSRAKNHCLQLEGIFENSENELNITHSFNLTDPMILNFVDKRDGLTQSFQFKKNSCSEGFAGVSTAPTFTFKFDYKMCEFEIRDQTNYPKFFYKKDCGYQHCKKLAGVYDKGTILSSIFGTNDGLKIMEEDSRYVKTGILYQVESLNAEERCKGEVRDKKLISQPDSCTVTWLKKNNQVETWKRTDKANC